jgi:nucleotide-binding universal stress UspA family protein
MSLASTGLKVQLRNVLVATDFSECSQRALLHAVAAAHHYGSTLHLVHVVPPAPFSVSPAEGYMGAPDAVWQAIDMARCDVQELAIAVLQRFHCEDLKYRTYVQTGSVGETLCAMIESEHIDLAVVGTHGRTGLRKIVLGSIAEDVFRRACCPVLTVGPHAWQSDPQTVRLKHILFPTDFSHDSARALPFVISIADDFGAALTLLHVVELLGSEASHDRARVVQGLEERMREMVAGTGERPSQMQCQVEFGEVAEMVLQTASRLGADLIAFGLKAPDTYVDRLPWMHAYQIVCEAGCPVLSVRGPSGRHGE